MSTKKNLWTKVIGAMNGLIKFGSVGSKADCTASFKVVGLDGRHFLMMEEDGEREGWFTLSSPGCSQIVTGEDLKKGTNAFCLLAENGDIVIRAEHGKIRLQALDFDIVTLGEEKGEGQFKVRAGEAISLDSKNITVDAGESIKIKAQGFLGLKGGTATQIISPIIKGVSRATNPKIGFNENLDKGDS